MNGADVIAEILKREGTEFLACYPRNPLIEACAAIDIRPILCRQERVGVGMADGFSRIRRGRQNGVFAAQHGPGIENAFPGVAQAFSENVPLLVIPAAFGTERQYIRPTFRAAEVFGPVTKWSAMASSVQELPDLMRRAYQAMRSGKPGPVLVEVPNPVFEASFDGKLDYVPVPVARTAPDPDAVKQAARMLLAAKHPVLWAGQGVHYADASERLAALAELIPAPVVATNPGKSAIAESHPLALGAATRSSPKMFAQFLNGADLVLAIGSSLTKTSFGPAVPPGKTLIHSTNDAGDVNKDYRADLALIGDAALVLDALIEEVGGGAVDDRHFGLQRNPQRDVRGVAADGAEHGPDLIVIGHLDEFVARSSPGRLVVVDHQMERLAPVAAGRIRFFDRKLRSVEHPSAEPLVGMILQRPEKPDADLIDISRLHHRYIARRAVVFHQLRIVLVIGSREFRERSHIVRGVRVAPRLPVLRRRGRIRATRAGARPLRPHQPRRDQSEKPSTGFRHLMRTPWLSPLAVATQMSSP